MPIFTVDHRQIAAQGFMICAFFEPPLAVDHLGQLAQRHPVGHRQGMHAHEGAKSRIEDGAIGHCTVGVRAIQYNHFQMMLGGRLHHVMQCG